MIALIIYMTDRIKSYKFTTLYRKIALCREKGKNGTNK